MGEKSSKILPLDVAEEICATEYGNEIVKELKDICYKMRDLKIQMITKLPPEKVTHAIYKNIWTLLYHLPPKNQVKFLQACIKEIKEKGKEWGE